MTINLNYMNKYFVLESEYICMFIVHNDILNVFELRWLNHKIIDLFDLKINGLGITTERYNIIANILVK